MQLTDFQSWFALGIGAFVLYGLWRAMQPKWTVKIVVAPDGIKHQQGLPKSQQDNIRTFFENDVSITETITIQALRYSKRYIRLQIAGQIDPGTRQRIRNFLMDVL